MTSISKNKILRKRFRSLRKRQRLLKKIQSKRRKSLHGLRLHNRLRMYLYTGKGFSDIFDLEWKKKLRAYIRTAKLNRSLRRGRKK